jgi:hypothetical protein
MLRDLETPAGSAVIASDGEIGRALRRQPGSLRMKPVRRPTSPVPTGWVESISWADQRVNLYHTREGL